MNTDTQDRNRTGKEREEALDRATELLNSLMDNSLSEEKKREIRGWFASQASMESKYESLRKLFDSLKPNLAPDDYEFKRCEELLNKLDPVNDRPAGVKSVARIPLRKRILRVAAVVIPAMLLAGGIYLWVNRAKDAVEQPLAALVSVSTPADSQKHLMLPDSSEVWLNASSTLTYPEDFNTDRRVTLTGEAYFHVKKADGATFSVTADGLTATVLGTEFNVKAYGDGSDAEIVLNNGSVMVTVADAEHHMKPLDRLVLSAATGEVSIGEMSGTDSWRTGMEFNGNPLSEIFAAMAGRFNFELEINGQLPDDQIRFGFDYDATPQEILSVLKAAHPYFTYTLAGGKLTVTAN